MNVGKALVLSCLACMGCAVQKQMLAATGDFTDYRAFRAAAQEGTRLARAQTYLTHHPHGAWADEVRQAFDAEEATWFEAAKTSRTAARDYIVDLPRGPHIQAARALLGLYYQPEQDIDMLELLAQARRSAAYLEIQSERRRRLSDLVLEELGALLDPATSGATLADPPGALAAVLRGPHPRTWGKSVPTALREDELYFGLPTPTEVEARVVKVTLRLVTEFGRIVGGRIEGEDLFVRWAEANEIRVLDATAASDRAAAGNDVADVLAGALEARLPASRCAIRRSKGELVARACDGWHASVRMGARPGDKDVIVVSRARPPGMR
ncbi:MAG TPA: hypothetical protein VN894_19330 [Polyangiaceae bacterium]|nr:hypothetical protein [Polyangiaceae bacterium]